MLSLKVNEIGALTPSRRPVRSMSRPSLCNGPRARFRSASIVASEMCVRNSEFHAKPSRRARQDSKRWGDHSSPRTADPLGTPELANSARHGCFVSRFRRFAGPRGRSLTVRWCSSPGQCHVPNTHEGPSANIAVRARRSLRALITTKKRPLSRPFFMTRSDAPAFRTLPTPKP
jgi:hypothetical protein